MWPGQAPCPKAICGRRERKDVDRVSPLVAPRRERERESRRFRFKTPSLSFPASLVSIIEHTGTNVNIKCMRLTLEGRDITIISLNIQGHTHTHTLN